MRLLIDCFARTTGRKGWGTLHFVDSVSLGWECYISDYVYAQLELSIEACKDHDALRELNQILPEFARVMLRPSERNECV